MIQSDAGKGRILHGKRGIGVPRTTDGSHETDGKGEPESNRRNDQTIKRSNESNCNNLLAKRSPLAKVPGGGLLMFRLPRNAAMLHAAPVSSRVIAMFCVEIEEAEVLVMAMANRTEDTSSPYGILAI
ncbi:hypothetical protein GX48_03759 [Paracoccidioides brasiliensis]|nr:hypothetical protein GX48_03759 [Paracoccidioides brasiliensis]